MTSPTHSSAIMKRLFEEPGESKKPSLTITDTFGPSSDLVTWTSISSADALSLPPASDATARVQAIQPADVAVSARHISDNVA
jgi:hypothetical protein